MRLYVSVYAYFLSAILQSFVLHSQIIDRTELFCILKFKFVVSIPDVF